MNHSVWQDKLPRYDIEPSRFGKYNKELNRWEPTAGWPIGETREIEGVSVTLVDYTGFHEEGNYETEYRIVVDVYGEFFKLTGTYYSHVGLEWNWWQQVYPKEVTTIVYE